MLIKEGGGQEKIWAKATKGERFPKKLPKRFLIATSEIKWYNNLIMRQSSSAILELLAASSEPITYQQIARETGSKSPKTALSKLKKKVLVDNTDKNQWVVTNKGQELLKKQLGKPITVAREEVPLSMEDTFREVGKALYFSKQGARLDNIIYYVKAISGFINPISIWNALTDFNLTPRVKYTWIRAYLAIASPQERIPAELEEKRYLFLKEGEELI